MAFLDKASDPNFFRLLNARNIIIPPLISMPITSLSGRHLAIQISAD